MSHIQIACKDVEVFEYAIDLVREHVAQNYFEYFEQCVKALSDQTGPTEQEIVVSEMGVQAHLQGDTEKKLTIKLQNMILNHI